MMETESPPPASPHTATDNTEVLSRRASLGHGEVRKAANTALESEALAAENMGVQPPWRPTVGALTSPAPSRTPFWKPKWLRNRISDPLPSKGKR